MSVTFRPELGPIDHYTVECLNCYATHGAQFPTYAQASAFRLMVRQGCAVIDGCAREPHYCAEGAFVEAQDTLVIIDDGNNAYGLPENRTEHT